MQRRFQLSSDGAKARIKKNRTVVLIMLPISLILGLYLGSNGQIDGSLFFTVPFLIIILWIVMRTSVKKQMEHLKTYEIIIDEDFIQRKQRGFLDLTIMKNEILSISEQINRGMMIKTVNKMKTIHIPSELNGYDEIKEILREWNAIKQIQRKNNPAWITLASGLLTLLAMAVIFLSNNRLLVIPVGILFIVFMIVSGIVIFRSSQVDERTKKAAVLLLFPIIPVVAKLMILMQ